MKVLVLAPRFPSLNQPWIDTYLEQLQKNNIDFSIYSTIESPKKYNSKVDELRLRDHVLDFKLNTNVTVKYFFHQLVTKPSATIREITNCFRETREISVSIHSRIISSLIWFYFSGNSEIFEGISLIHSHEEISGYLFLHLSKQLNIPFVLTFHGLPPKGVGQLAKSKRDVMYENASAVLVNTEFAKSQVISLGALEDTIRIIPQGLPIENFPCSPSVHPGEAGAIKILTIGRFHRDKGQRFALLALKRLLDAGYSAEWHFVGVGSGVEELVQCAAKLKIEQFTHFHVEIGDVELKRLYQVCHIFCLCSVDNAVHIETQGVVIQEAQASGCLVVATKVGGVPECLNDHEDGLLIKAKSSRAIFDAITFYQDNPGIWDSYLGKGRSNVENNFSADHIGKRMAEILTSERSTYDE